MAWSYDPTLASGKDRVRWLVGDTDANDPLIKDEEILFALIENPRLYRAAALVCRATSARLMRELTLVGSAGSIELDAQRQAEKFARLADEYDAQAVARGGAGIYAGGISRSDVRSQTADGDRVAPGFTITLHRSRLLESSPLVGVTDES
jgi:hypothetical protein